MAGITSVRKNQGWGWGEVILLASGGHGFEFLEETEMVEVKQGLNCGEQDKVRFKGKIRGGTTWV